MIHGLERSAVPRSLAFCRRPALARAVLKSPCNPSQEKLMTSMTRTTALLTALLALCSGAGCGDSVARAEALATAPAQKAAPASSPATPTPASTSAPTLTIKRLLIATGVDAREPIGAASEFSTTDTARLYAFVEVENSTAAASEVTVTWVDTTTGKERKPYTLSIGASKRWRTWMRAAAPKQPGSYAVVLKDATGAELARVAYVMK
jgi:hypothetical protein